MKPVPNATPPTPRPPAWASCAPVSARAPRPVSSKPSAPQPQHASARSRPRWREWWPTLLLLGLVSLNQGCASSPTTFLSTELPASLREPCPQLPAPQQGDAIYVFLYLRDVIALYNLCAERHDRTVEAWPK